MTPDLLIGLGIGVVAGMCFTALLAAGRLREAEEVRRCAFCKNRQARICTDCVNESAAQQQPRDSNGKFVKKDCSRL